MADTPDLTTVYVLPLQAAVRNPATESIGNQSRCDSFFIRGLLDSTYHQVLARPTRYKWAS